MKRDQLNSFEYLKDALYLHFKPTEKSCQFKYEIENCKQNKSESVIDFYLRFSHVCHSAYTDSFHLATDYFVHLFISGLFDGSMKSHVCLKYPKSLQEALSFCLEYEAVENYNVNVDSTEFSCHKSYDFTSIFQALERFASLLNEFMRGKNKRNKKKCYRCRKVGRARCPQTDDVCCKPSGITSSDFVDREDIENIEGQIILSRDLSVGMVYQDCDVFEECSTPCLETG